MTKQKCLQSFQQNSLSTPTTFLAHGNGVNGSSDILDLFFMSLLTVSDKKLLNLIAFVCECEFEQKITMRMIKMSFGSRSQGNRRNYVVLEGGTSQCLANAEWWVAWCCTFSWLILQCETMCFFENQ